MAEDLSLTMGTAAKGSSGRAYRWESFWTCCQCERNGEVGVSIALGNSTCRNGHQRCDSCVVQQVKISATKNSSDYEDTRSADSADKDDEYLLRYNPTAPRSRPRAASCDSTFCDRQRRQPRPSLSPLVSWDDSALGDKHHVALRAEKDRLQKGQNMGITLRRTANINVFDDSVSDISLRSGPSSLAGSDSEDGLLEKRLLHPVEYFQELDDLGSKIYQRSMFPFYTDGTMHRLFDGAVHFDAPFLENASFQTCTHDEILSFCKEVTNFANDNPPDLGAGSHYVDHRMYHRQIAELNHLIECRNIISGVWENIKEMKTVCYCGDFISLLVLDRTRHGVASLIRIECSRIEQLAIAFEKCLLKVMSCAPAMVLFDNITTLANDVSTACREVLTKIGMNIPELYSKDIWRCVVHILDIAALSYAGAHTQFLGNETITSVPLPGPFLETQYFRFCRRKFSCLREFLAGQEAWVVEPYHASTLHVDLPPLCLLTDAVTFGDIWGPMWKSCMLGDEDRISQYSVGNGVIIPWNRPSPTSRDTIEVRKGEVFCHFMSDKERRDQEGLANSLTWHGNDFILIGAPARLDANDTCRASMADHRQRLRSSGSLTEPGTVRPGRVLDSETVQVQVTPPHMGLGYQRQYKRRGRSMTDSLIEKWKNSPQSRQVRYIEFKLGLEVSTCTYNARRIRLIELFGTQTMINHLRNGSLRWTSTECRDSFYSALQSDDYTAFRRLYESQPGWQADIGNAVGCCFDALTETGKSEKDLVLFWTPNAEPGQKVTLKPDDLSWIGFLEDTETSGTLAVLEDKCLELPDLDIGRKCLSSHFDPRHIGSGISTGGTFDGAILETSVHLNESCVPTSISKGRTRSKRRDGTPSRYRYRWSLSSLEDGDKFEFGKKGSLKTITLLTQGQILAKWGSSLDIMRQLQMISSKIPVLGRIIDEPCPNMHYECIRDSQEDTSPVSFIILSTSKTAFHSAQVSRRASLNARSAPLDCKTLYYKFDSSDSGLPRNMVRTSQPLQPEDTIKDLQNIVDRWKALTST